VKLASSATRTKMRSDWRSIGALSLLAERCDQAAAVYPKASAA
jgi:hypothetical protein